MFQHLKSPVSFGMHLSSPTTFRNKCHNLSVIQQCWNKRFTFSGLAPHKKHLEHNWILLCKKALFATNHGEHITPHGACVFQFYFYSQEQLCSPPTIHVNITGFNSELAFIIDFPSWLIWYWVKHWNGSRISKSSAKFCHLPVIQIPPKIEFPFLISSDRSSACLLRHLFILKGIPEPL